MGDRFDPNMLANLAGVEDTIHRSINDMWNGFRNRYKDKLPTEEAVLNFAKKVHSKYGKSYMMGGK